MPLMAALTSGPTPAAASSARGGIFRKRVLHLQASGGGVGRGAVDELTEEGEGEGNGGIVVVVDVNVGLDELEEKGDRG
jgi:hypothetical protein